MSEPMKIYDGSAEAKTARKQAPKAGTASICC